MELTHINEQGRARMVDVTLKEITFRQAEAEGRVRMNPETVELIRTGGAPKGDVLAVAQVAGIMAAKRTHELIPMCHPLRLTAVDISFTLEETAVHIRSQVKCRGETGVEMEALTAASADHLRHVQGRPAGHGDHGRPPLPEKRRQDRRLCKGVVSMAEVVSVNISEKKGTVKREVPEIHLKLRHGIVGDAHAGDLCREHQYPGAGAENPPHRDPAPPGGDGGGGHPDRQGVPQRLRNQTAHREVRYAHGGHFRRGGKRRHSPQGR